MYLIGFIIRNVTVSSSEFISNNKIYTLSALFNYTVCSFKARFVFVLNKHVLGCQITLYKLENLFVFENFVSCFSLLEKNKY